MEGLAVPEVLVGYRHSSLIPDRRDIAIASRFQMRTVFVENIKPTGPARPSEH